MLFLLFQLGEDRYALEASRVVEVLPLLEVKRLAQAPKGVAGIFNYRGQAVLAVDLSLLTLGRPASDRLSTRIIIVDYPDETGKRHLLGLVAEHATGTLHKEAAELAGSRAFPSPDLGPILMDTNGPIHWVHEQRLLPQDFSKLLFSEFPTKGHIANGAMFAQENWLPSNQNPT